MVLIKKKSASAAEAAKVVSAPSNLAEAKNKPANDIKAAKDILPQKRKIPAAVKKATDQEINAPAI